MNDTQYVMDVDPRSPPADPRRRRRSFRPGFHALSWSSACARARVASAGERNAKAPHVRDGRWSWERLRGRDPRNLQMNRPRAVRLDLQRIVPSRPTDDAARQLYVIAPTAVEMASDLECARRMVIYLPVCAFVLSMGGNCSTSGATRLA